MTVFFLFEFFFSFCGKTKLSLILYFFGALQKDRTSAEDIPTRKYEEPKAAEEQSRAKTPTLNSTLRWRTNQHLKGKVISKPFEPKTSHLSNLYTIPPLSIVYYLLYCYRNGIEWHRRPT